DASSPVQKKKWWVQFTGCWGSVFWSSLFRSTGNCLDRQSLDDSGGRLGSQVGLLPMVAGLNRPLDDVEPIFQDCGLDSVPHPTLTWGKLYRIPPNY
ncbi:hypothetical protein LINPERPRIM_LOCUS26153, partial [Linum perenne]